MIKSELKLGDILKNQKLIIEEQLQQALLEQKATGKKLGQVLMQMKIVTEKDIAMALSKQLAIMFVDRETGLLRPNMHQSLEKLIHEDYSIEHSVLPLSKHSDSLTVAMIDPLDLMTIDDIMKLTSCDVNVVVTTPTDILESIKEFYGSKEMKKKGIQEKFVLMDGETVTRTDKVNVRDVFSDADAAPIVKFVDLILMDAVEQGASDIHIEHYEERVRLRYRVDGVLYEANAPAESMYFAIISLAIVV